MDKVAISVIIPVYNAERHLEECLDSCLQQTLSQIEIICINDGSIDSTAKILEKYASKHSKIVILNQKNQGAGIARNLGIEYAKGEFIAFMDSDDYYLDKDALKKLYVAAIEENVLVCGGGALFLNEGKLNQSDTRHCFQENRIMYYKEYQKTGGFTQFLYNTHFLRESKIKFPAYRRYQDPPFFVQIMTKARSFYVIRDCVYVIRNTDKIVKYDNKSVVVGVLHGIMDILNISRQNQFEVLHRYMVDKVMDIYISSAYKLIYRGDEEIYQCYKKVILEIDETLLANGIQKIRKPKCMSIEEIKRMVELSLKKEWKLLNMVNSYKKIFIYGAGRVGRSFYYYLKQRGCKVDIEFMVSAQNPNYTACGKQVYSIQECIDNKYDAIVIIAVADKSHIKLMEETAQRYQFPNIEIVLYDEIMLFGADIMDCEMLTIY